MNVSVLADTEVAHRHVGEALRSDPLPAPEQVRQDVDPERVEFVAQEYVEKEELADCVDEVDDLDDQVADGEVAAVTAVASGGTASYETEATADAGAVLSRLEIPVAGIGIALRLINCEWRGSKLLV